jgi:hypothetical protein
VRLRAAICGISFRRSSYDLARFTKDVASTPALPRKLQPSLRIFTTIASTFSCTAASTRRAGDLGAGCEVRCTAELYVFFGRRMDRVKILFFSAGRFGDRTSKPLSPRSAREFT